MSVLLRGLCLPCVRIVNGDLSAAQLLGEAHLSSSKEILFAQSGCFHIFLCSGKNCLSVWKLLIAGGERGFHVCGRHLIVCLIDRLMGGEARCLCPQQKILKLCSKDPFSSIKMLLEICIEYVFIKH